MGGRCRRAAAVAGAGRQDAWVFSDLAISAKRWPAERMHSRCGCAPIRRQAQSVTPDGVAFIGGPERLDEVLRRADFPRRHAVAVTRDTRPARCAQTALDEAQRLPDQCRARRDRRRGGALSSTGTRTGSPGLPSMCGIVIRPPLAQRSPSTQPFHELANVLMTPHVSGWTEGMLEARAALIADNIDRTARGEPPLNAVD